MFSLCIQTQEGDQNSPEQDREELFAMLSGS